MSSNVGDNPSAKNVGRGRTLRREEAANAPCGSVLISHLCQG